MSNKANEPYDRLLELVIGSHPEPYRYDHAVAELSFLYPPGRAHRETVNGRNSMRRKRNIAEFEDEVSDRTVRYGRRRLARNCIFDAVRNGRLNINTDDSGIKWLTLDTPASSGGRHAIPGKWPIEQP